MEAWLASCVSRSLSLHCVRNATFLAERLCASFPNEPNFQLLASCYLRANKPLLARHVLKGLPSDQSRYLLALACYDLQLLTEAEAALQPNPSSMILPPSLQSLIASSSSPASSPSAASAQRSHEPQVPNGAAGLYLLGLICKATNRRQVAIRHFTSALALDPFFWSAYEELCILGAEAEASQAFNETAALHMEQQQQRVQQEVSVQQQQQQPQQCSQQQQQQSGQGQEQVQEGTAPPQQQPAQQALNAASNYVTPPEAVVSTWRDTASPRTPAGPVAPAVSAATRMAHRRKMVDENRLRNVAGRLFAEPSTLRRSTRLAEGGAGGGAAAGAAAGSASAARGSTGVGGGGGTSRGSVARRTTDGSSPVWPFSYNYWPPFISPPVFPSRPSPPPLSTLPGPLPCFLSSLHVYLHYPAPFPSAPSLPLLPLTVIILSFPLLLTAIPCSPSSSLLLCSPLPVYQPANPFCILSQPCPLWIWEMTLHLLPVMLQLLVVVGEEEEAGRLQHQQPPLPSPPHLHFLPYFPSNLPSATPHTAADLPGATPQDWEPKQVAREEDREARQLQQPGREKSGGGSHASNGGASSADSAAGGIGGGGAGAGEEVEGRGALGRGSSGAEGGGREGEGGDEAESGQGGAKSGGGGVYGDAGEDGSAGGGVGKGGESGALLAVRLLKQVGRAFLLLCMMRCQEAIEAFSELPASQYNTHWVLVQVGRAYVDMVQYGEAERVFEMARQASPCHVDGLDIYSTVLFHMRKDVQLSLLAQEALAVDRMAPQAWWVGSSAVQWGGVDC
ncbi:unnamed protein product [Closterium sp. NIES-54]